MTFPPRIMLAAIVALVGLLAAAVITTTASGLERDQLVIDLSDGAVELNTDELSAGKIEIEARNERGTEQHELLIVRTNKPVDALPRGLAAVSLPLTGKIIVGADHDAHSHEVEEEPDRGPFPGQVFRVATPLEPGRYVVLCNFPGHYAAGEAAAFTVSE